MPSIPAMVVAKRTSKNQLTPLHPGGADAVRTRLAELGISEADVTDAANWARQP
ncbi:hypothetical protein KBY72_12305 [Cyanobium sp. BA5m-21]|uniref:hypothetical protein n=1 Tax=Cyanobium sp. BA5m-21 TaxID=2823706 RepID=UPI0020CE96CA|nr:hypothetical protein [Cyanobium sp. BA5m-21]MCP9905360.1 hypothetical protein [Cyanobium sp. BA5m-10]MCP9907949.1 hypothetical protein [Cyanobium sp. BA5m-21]